MSASAKVSTAKTLRRLYLRIFLRGRTSRGLQAQEVPKSLGKKLALALIFYGLFGLVSLAFFGQPIFALSLYLHASTLMFLGTFLAGVAGEALFNAEESDILLHRPIDTRTLLWAKVSVLVQVSVWLAGAFNLTGLIVGTVMPHGSTIFFVAHSVSLVLEALFCTGLLVVSYQLCLRWFGKERLDALITTVQTFMAVAIVLGSQLAPRWLMRPGNGFKVVVDSWWVLALPPAWFAGIDDAVAGTGAVTSWALAALAVISTAVLLWFGFGTLARYYAAGLQTLNEGAPARPSGPRKRRFASRLASSPLLGWWLKDPATRAAFMLSAAYLARDREVKLRVYPGLAPMMMMPIIFILPGGAASSGGFGWAFGGAYLGLIAMLGLNFLKYSTQWQAADIFRAAPIKTPAPLCHGARKATILVLAVPFFAVFGVLIAALGAKLEDLPMLLPGLIALPALSLIPCLNGEAVPFAIAGEEAASAQRGLQMIGSLLLTGVIAGLATFANSFGYLWWFLAAEVLIGAASYFLMHRVCARAKWPATD